MVDEPGLVQSAVAREMGRASWGLGLVPRALRAALRFVLTRLFVFELEGLQQVPRGRYIAAANHPAWLETFALVAFLPAERGLRMLASRRATMAIGWRRAILNLADAVLPLDMDQGDIRAAIRTAVESLRGGAAVGIFPEDLTLPTNPEGQVRPLRRGVAFLARSSESPVVPVGVADTRELWRGRRIRLRIGQPLPPPRTRQEDEAFLATLASTLEALRPPAEPLPSNAPWRWLSRLF
jgi:1-acyl-sn-glycerol-3-phosphate acyltransferase